MTRLCSVVWISPDTELGTRAWEIFESQDERSGCIQLAEALEFVDEGYDKTRAKI